MNRAEQLKKSGASQWMIDEELSKLRNGWFYKRLEELAEEFFGLVSVASSPGESKRSRNGIRPFKEGQEDKLKHDKWYKADIDKIRMDGYFDL